MTADEKDTQMPSPEPGAPQSDTAASDAVAAEADQAADGELPVYDFRKASRVGRNRSRALHAMHEIFSDALSGWMTAKMRSEVRVRLEALDEVTFSQIVSGLEKPCTAYLYEVPGRAGLNAMILVGPRLAFIAVDRMLGGSLDSETPERALTNLESRVVALLAERVREGVEAMWADHVAFTLNRTAFESFPDMMRFAQPGEAFLVSRMKVQSETWESEVSIHLPFALLEAALDAQAGSHSEGPTLSAQVERRLLESHLLEARVTIDARLPAFPVSLGQLGTLAPGVVLATRIPTSTPVEISVCGQKRFLGSAGRSGPDLAVRVTTPMSILSDH